MTEQEIIKNKNMEYQHMIMKKTIDRNFKKSFWQTIVTDIVALFCEFIFIVFLTPFFIFIVFLTPFLTVIKIFEIIFNR
jgi:hypothetical protein